SAAGLKALAAAGSDRVEGKIHVIPLDVTEEASIVQAAQHVGAILSQVGPIPGATGLDYLIQNAAITLPGDGDNPLTLEASSFKNIMNTNVLGPALVMKYMHPYLKRSFRPVIVNMSSGLASIPKDLGARSTSYSISKAALHMLTYKQAKTCTDMIVLSVHPAWAKTDMGTEMAPLEPSFVVHEIIQLLQRVTLSDSGKFMRYDGAEIID
ncbi:hypothetical protein FRC08_011369, partial [Ceratobasidium sp. 394]